MNKTLLTKILLIAGAVLAIGLLVLLIETKALDSHVKNAKADSVSQSR